MMEAGTKKQRRSDENDPVIVAHGCQGARPFDIHDSDLLEQMIAPFSSNDFLTRIFRSKALYVHNDASRVTELIATNMYDLEAESIFRETSSEHVFLWLTQPDGKISSLELQDVEHAIALHRAGHATYCRAPPTVEQPMVYHLLRGTGLGCGGFDPTGQSSTSLGRGEVEVFFGTTGHTTDWHYDFQENFTIQLSGSKRWNLQSSTIKYPLRGCTPHYASPDTVESQLKAAHLSHDTFTFGPPDNATNSVGKTQSVTLTPGDMLYFPAGMWHKVETLEPGVSINVSLMATNYAAVTAQAIQHFLLQDDAWRETIVSGPTSARDTALEHLEKLLNDLPEKIEGFIKQNGAEAILPPVVRFPPRLDLSKEDGNGEWNDIDEDDEQNECDEEPQDYQDDDELGMNDEGNEIDKKLSEMFGCQVVHVLSFERPEGWSLSWDPASDYIRNPLAHVVSIDQVRNYYSPNNETYDKYWLLNINYAGNEMQESAVRVILKDDKNPLELMSTADNDKRRQPSFRTKIECFLYYGLYVLQRF